MASSSYKLISKKGQGGMAEVFKAVKSGPGDFSKTVALKKIIPMHSDHAEFIRMLSTEAKIHSYLNHPNIVQLLDFFEEDSQHSMVLEYVDGKNLKEIVTLLKEKNKRLPWQACIFITMETLKALSYAHNKQGSDGPLNIIHRDVSPHNILISYQGEVKLSDFGIARAQIARDETASGVLKGKYRYLSPEQVLNEDLSPSSDLFSIGVTLYELLSSEHPFGDQQEYQTFQKILEAQQVPLIELVNGINPAISDIVDHALRKKYNDRYQDARDFYEALLKIQDPVWITHGQERLAKLLLENIPEDLRQDIPIEKTSILTNPIVTQHSLLDSATTVATTKPSINISPLYYIIPVIVGLLIGLGLMVIKSQKSASTPDAVIVQKTSLESTVIQPETKQNKNIKIAPIPTKNLGKLEIHGPLGVHVYVNGKFMGDIPLSTMNLPAGSYIVLLDHDEQGQQIKKIAVNSHEPATIYWR